MRAMDFPYNPIPETEQVNNRKLKSSIFLFTVAGLAVVIFGLAASSSLSIQNFSSTTSSAKSSSSPIKKAALPRKSGYGSVTERPVYASSKAAMATSGLKVTTNRVGYPILEYFGESPSTVLKYKILEDYIGVVEPHANMSISFVGTVVDNADRYTYTVCATSDTSSDCSTYKFADSFYYECSAGDTFTLSVSDENDQVVSEGSLMCIYVRRELRSLTAEDLDASVQAMWTMWDLEQDEGEALYGDDFLNYARLLEFHYFNAAWKSADHVHEGLGFLPQHLKMDLYFSKSLTAINPSLQLFYWDFTIENATGLSVWESPMFTDSTFGTLALPTDMTRGWSYENDQVDDGAIQDSLWKSFKTDMNTKYADLDYGYGYMRSPWNLNPSEMLTRFTSIDKYLPTCEDHYDFASYTTYTDYLFEAPYGIHASTHGALGGVFGCDKFDSLLDAGLLIDEQAKLDLCKNWIFYLKEFYRNDFITPMSDCTAEDENGDYSTEESSQNCGFTCNSEDSTLFRKALTDILNSDYTVVDFSTVTAEGMDTWVDFVCSGDGYKIFGGDHLESASPADPSFWPIHPTLERLTQAKFMANGFTDLEWPTDAATDYVCNRNECYDDDTDEYGDWSTCCYGHYEFDQLMDADDGDRFTGVGPTNNEIMSWNDASSTGYAMDYIYDSFTWEHCSDAGYDLKALFESQYADLDAFIATSGLKSTSKGAKSVRAPPAGKYSKSPHNFQNIKRRR